MSIPQIADDLSGVTTFVRQPDLTYKINDENISGRITKIDSIKQAIRSIIMTERYSNPIYDKDYGIELEQYIGKDLGYIKAGIQDTLQDALLQDDRIISVNVTDVSKSLEQQEACVIQFTVNTIYGELNDSFNIMGE